MCDHSYMRVICDTLDMELSQLWDTWKSAQQDFTGEVVDEGSIDIFLQHLRHRLSSLLKEKKAAERKK